MESAPSQPAFARPDAFTLMAMSYVPAAVEIANEPALPGPDEPTVEKVVDSGPSARRATASPVGVPAASDLEAPILPTARVGEVGAEPPAMPLARTPAPAYHANGNGATALTRTRIETRDADGIVRRQVLIQRVAAGEQPAGGLTSPAPAATPAEAEHHASQEQGQTGDEGAAAGDIHLLANEVYGLIKRRLAYEAERMGRSR